MELRSLRMTVYAGALALIACGSSAANSTPFDNATKIANDASTSGSSGSSSGGTGSGSGSSGGSSSGGGGSDNMMVAGSCTQDSDCSGGCDGASVCCCETSSSTCYSPQNGACGSGDSGASGDDSGDDSGGDNNPMP